MVSLKIISTACAIFLTAGHREVIDDDDEGSLLQIASAPAAKMRHYHVSVKDDDVSLSQSDGPQPSLLTFRAISGSAAATEDEYGFSSLPCSRFTVSKGGEDVGECHVCFEDEIAEGTTFATLEATDAVFTDGSTEDSSVMSGVGSTAVPMDAPTASLMSSSELHSMVWGGMFLNIEGNDASSSIMIRIPAVMDDSKLNRAADEIAKEMPDSKNVLFYGEGAKAMRSFLANKGYGYCGLGGWGCRHRYGYGYARYGGGSGRYYR